MLLTPQPAISLAMFPKSEPKRFAACASGEFDGYLDQIAGILKAQGALTGGRRPILRLGWEANIGSHSHPWGVDTAADARGYQSCFRHEVALLREALPGAMFEWTNATVSHTPGPSTMTYPGDAYADLWGLHYYDAGARFGTEALWDAYYGSTYKGGPQGLGTWLKAAAAHGKRLAVSEWGVRQPLGTDPALSDDPFYIGKIFQTLSSNASEIAYDNYFNCPSTSRLYPDTLFPKAAAEYRKLWSAGP
jgi:hypothetical protein